MFYKEIIGTVLKLLIVLFSLQFIMYKEILGTMFELEVKHFCYIQSLQVLINM
jgi:hypothetical protein